MKPCELPGLALVGLALVDLAAPGPLPAAPPRHGLPIVKSTTTPDGQTLDWVPVSSQGTAISSPPPRPLLRRAPSRRDAAMVEAIRPSDPGPAGTVPILRARGPTKPMKQPPRPDDHNATTAAAAAAAALSGGPPSYQGRHWYASTAQTVDNHGGTATYSLFEAFVQHASDFSLLQAAVVRNDAAHAGTPPKSQTVEAGWINYPDQGAAPHLFSFYTTNNYESYGDYVCGWNRDVAGWVQYDPVVYPGVALAPLAAVRGARYEADIGFYYYQGNWWLHTLGRFVGYYPGGLFSRGVSPTDTLDHHADQISFYGEVYNGEDGLTTSDMGSGEFPDAGLGSAAYLRSIAYYDTADSARDYDGSGHLIVSDETRYALLPACNSSSDWGTYFYIGGPGAGGVVGA
ncbi:carboxyl-terminal proteinase [Metarhizium album ARSEF 1941]|uniref:Carboxyl-terminal proteinase n=1 Tax=Metarhizium album (strain ARSEF 1941) TaxID=1081103 RepID=A0A0B2X615_METAS|nr:carboxyl-terminal proteinase [Metarhizium album ARSEF 1941]KHO01799.1 carboxyl-terminal proteinase [Metarhizium album ARSEF 1941]